MQVYFCQNPTYFDLQVHFKLYFGMTSSSNTCLTPTADILQLHNQKLCAYLSIVKMYLGLAESLPP